MAKWPTMRLIRIIGGKTYRSYRSLFWACPLETTLNWMIMDNHSSWQCSTFLVSYQESTHTHKINRFTNLTCLVTNHYISLCFIVWMSFYSHKNKRFILYAQFGDDSPKSLHWVVPFRLTSVTSETGHCSASTKDNTSKAWKSQPADFFGQDSFKEFSDYSKKKNDNNHHWIEW